MNILTSLASRLLDATRFVSRIANRLIGGMLLLVVALIVVEVVLRKLGLASLRGVTEYSGYVLAILSSWTLAHTLIERAHIRIDLGYSKMPPVARTLLDLVSIFSVVLVGWVIALHAWPVLARSWSNGSLANTPLSTPLWIPQLIWALGYIWFAIAASVLGVRAVLAALLQGRAEVQALVGMTSESPILDAAKEERR